MKLKYSIKPEITFQSFEDYTPGLYVASNGQKFLAIKNHETGGPKTIVFYVDKEGKLHYNPTYTNYLMGAKLLTTEVTLIA